jgi:hypothetical protein
MESAYYYLGGDALHTGIYVDLIRRLEDEGLVVGLVGRLRVSPDPLATWRAWEGRRSLGPNRIETVRASIQGGVHQVPVWNLFPGLSAPALARALGLAAKRGGRVVVHTRQIVMARLALALKRRRPELRVICELEGDDLAEVRYKRSKAVRPAFRQRLLWNLEHRFYERVERRILVESDAVICVSRNLREVMVRRYSLSPRQAERLHVIPTLASHQKFHFDSAKRDRTRRDLGLQDRFVVVYSGNLRGRWQVPEKLVEAFGFIRQVRPTAFFLILAPKADHGCLEPLLSSAGLSSGEARLLACSHEQVVDHLCAGDIGLLLRDRHPMNEVAAPGKFAEYVLSGLPIVLTEGIGDFSAQMGGSELACVLPDLTDTDGCRERIQRFCAHDFDSQRRSAFSSWAAERFAVELSTPQLAALYRRV